MYILVVYRLLQLIGVIAAVRACMHDIVTGPGFTDLDTNFHKVVEYAEGFALKCFIGSAYQSLATNDNYNFFYNEPSLWSHCSTNS